MNDLHDAHGFTLVEIAIVLVIVGILLSGGLTILSSQQEMRRQQESTTMLSEAREALIGFAIVNGRLPCPADPTVASGAANAGVERAATPAGCTGGVPALQGVLPWATLGLPELDAWSHRFTYRVSASFARSGPFTRSSAGDITISVSAGGTALASAVPAALVSHGANGLLAYLPFGSQMPASADADETENGDVDTAFVNKSMTSTYDDLVVWLSPHILFNRMVSAGVTLLP